jgi:hypothetical protein
MARQETRSTDELMDGLRRLGGSIDLKYRPSVL